MNSDARYTYRLILSHPFFGRLRADEYYSDVKDAERYVSLRHNGADCHQVSKAKHHMCNKHYVQEEAGNSCAQVITKSHPIFYASGKAVDVSESDPEMYGSLRSGLRNDMLTCSKPQIWATREACGQNKVMEGGAASCR